MSIYIFFACIGAFAGFASGLLGIGGGVIMVPVLNYYFTSTLGYSPELSLSRAIATSLATVSLSALPGFFIHYKKKCVSFDLFFKLLAGIFIGTIAAQSLAVYINPFYIKSLFSLILCFLSYNMIRSKVNVKQNLIYEKLELSKWIAISTVVSALSSLVGIGGGALFIPVLLGLGVPIRLAIGTASFLTVFISFLSSLTIFYHNPQITPDFIGHIYVHAWVWLFPISVLMAPIGGRVSHATNTLVLKRIFGVLLLVLAIVMIKY